MKRTAVLALFGSALLVFGLVGIGGCATASAPKAPATVPTEKPATPDESASGFAAGDSVAAIWTDGNLYLATVQTVDGDQVTVKYADDSSTKTIPASDIKPIIVKTWTVGDKVLAVWTSGRFYSGTVIEASGGNYKIQWDDGSQPSDVVADKIVAP